MSSTFTARLREGQSAALMLATFAALAAASAVVIASSGAVRSAVIWCRDFLLATPAGTAGLAAAASAVVIAIALFRVAAAVIAAGFADVRLRRDIARRGAPASGRVLAALAVLDRPVPVSILDDRRPYAFTFGLVRPAVVVTSGLVSQLSLAELRAVLAHEAEHLRARHPMHALSWHLLRCAFFFLPAIGDIADHFSLTRELQADRAALRVSGGARPLASAMFKATSAPMFAGAAAFGRLSERIAALREGSSAAVVRVPMRRALATAAVALALAVQARAAPFESGDPSSASAQCEGAAQMRMSTINFSPFVRIRVAPASEMSEANAVQSPVVTP